MRRRLVAAPRRKGPPKRKRPLAKPTPTRQSALERTDLPTEVRYEMIFLEQRTTDVLLGDFHPDLHPYSEWTDAKGEPKIPRWRVEASFLIAPIGRDIHLDNIHADEKCKQELAKMAARVRNLNSGLEEREWKAFLHKILDPRRVKMAKVRRKSAKTQRRTVKGKAGPTKLTARQFCCQLIVENASRKQPWTDDEILTKVLAKFPESGYKLSYVGGARYQLNQGSHKAFPKPKTPYVVFRKSAEKPTRSAKKVKKATKSAPKRKAPRRKKAS